MNFKTDLLELNRHWLVVNKPAGINVEQLWDYPSVETSVREYLRTQQPREPYLGVVHRLDRPVSGVLLMARKKSTLKALNQLFAERRAKKVYWAMTIGAPPANAGTLEHYLIKNRKNKRAEVYEQEQKGAVYARLHYRVAARIGEICCLEVRPLTGKFHQIRVQLSAIGCPLIGDVIYGGPAIDRPATIALHARSLRFIDPGTDKEVSLRAPLPASELWTKWNT